MKTTLLSLITIFTIIYLPSCSLLDSDTTLVDHIVGDDIYEKRVYIRDTFYLEKIVVKWDTIYITEWWIDTIYIDGEVIYDTVYVEVPIYIEVPVYDTVFVHDTEIVYIEVPGECPLRLEVISARLEGGHFYKKYKISYAENGSCHKPYIWLDFFEDQGFVFPTKTEILEISGFASNSTNGLAGGGLHYKGNLIQPVVFEVKIHCPDGDEALRMTIDTDGGGHIDDVTWLIW